MWTCRIPTSRPSLRTTRATWSARSASGSIRLWASPPTTLYPEELDRLRQAGHRLCEFTRLAVDSKAASKPVLAGLFHTAFLYASRLHGFTHAVIEVNPRHVSFYQRSLGFEIIGEERLNKRVNAPAVLLEVPFTSIDNGLHRAGRAPASGRASTLLLHGFPAGDEQGVLERLREKERAA